jgi:hypothetical protein
MEFFLEISHVDVSEAALTQLPPANKCAFSYTRVIKLMLLERVI